MSPINDDDMDWDSDESSKKDSFANQTRPTVKSSGIDICNNEDN